MGHQASDPSLEGLPTELKLAIFKRFHYREDAQRLIRASPSFRAVYLTNTEKIVAYILLNQCALLG